MSEIDGTHNGRQILTPVFITSSEAGARFASGTALIDTGATCSLVGLSIARELSLPARGKRLMITARGTETVVQYRFRIGIALEASQGGAGAMPFVFDEDFIGSELAVQSGFDVIVGMDVLKHGILTVRPDRRWSFRF